MNSLAQYLSACVRESGTPVWLETDATGHATQA